MKKYKVKEMFGPTLQGEGSQAGRAVLFLRFSGCNRWSGREEDRSGSICHFCDTDFLGGDMLTKEEISSKLLELGRGRVWVVVVSGGEPLLQLDLELATHLKEKHLSLYIETNGSIEPSWPLRSYVDHVTMSPKQSPSETKLRAADDIKVLFPPIRPDITPEAFDEFSCSNRYVQPVWRDDTDNTKKAIAEVLRLGSTWRLGLQLHKFLGVQ